MADDASWIEPTPVKLLTGDEGFQGMDATVREFWKWSTSDLRDDTTRGILAEFIVAKALGVPTESPRISWSNFDLTTPSGVSVEVKSSAYLQSWKQKKLSQRRFGGLSSRSWDPETGHGKEPEVSAQVFVFALQTCKDPKKYNALDIGQWEFYEPIRKRGSRSVGLPTLRRFANGPRCLRDQRGRTLGLGRLVSASAPHPGESRQTGCSDRTYPGFSITSRCSGFIRHRRCPSAGWNKPELPKVSLCMESDSL